MNVFIAGQVINCGVLTSNFSRTLTQSAPSSHWSKFPHVLAVSLIGQFQWPLRHQENFPLLGQTINFAAIFRVEPDKIYGRENLTGMGKKWTEFL